MRISIDIPCLLFISFIRCIIFLQLKANVQYTHIQTCKNNNYTTISKNQAKTANTAEIKALTEYTIWRWDIKNHAIRETGLCLALKGIDPRG